MVRASPMTSKVSFFWSLPTGTEREIRQDAEEGDCLPTEVFHQLDIICSHFSKSSLAKKWRKRKVMSNEDLTSSKVFLSLKEVQSLLSLQVLDFLSQKFKEEKILSVV